MKVVLIDDSHFARIRRDLPRLVCSEHSSPGSGGPEIVNVAVGGACTCDLQDQVAAAGLRPDDVVALSVGTNDAAPWKQLAVHEVAEQVDNLLADLSSQRLVYLAPPGVDEARLNGLGDRTNARTALYGAAIGDRFAGAGATVVDGRAAISRVGAAAFADDGVHLSGAGYDVFIAALAAAICTDTDYLGVVQAPGREGS